MSKKGENIYKRKDGRWEGRFHALRHTFVSNYLRLNFDIKSLSEILGHSNKAMTLNRYVHSSYDMKKKYMNLITI